MNKRTSSILQTLCLLASLVITYAAYQYGFGQAWTGNDLYLPLHAAAFCVAIGLVLVAIIIRIKTK